jgi:hypothetical protein
MRIVLLTPKSVERLLDPRKQDFVMVLRYQTLPA